jgi:hypothetical protein
MKLSATFTLVVLLAAALATGCRKTADTEPSSQIEVKQPIEDVLSRHAPQLMEIEGVVGVGQGLTDSGEDCLKVLVVADTPELRRRIPTSLEGYPVVLRPTGELEPK